ncbi:MAG: DUF885 family protein [Vicinamibacteraceae bacterium]|nr:DUF885 family protein [Vicinamibacteraceae bacterium]
MYSSEPLPRFIDDYLAYLHEVHPTTATFDGIHTHDDLLEDYSRQAIDAHLRDLGNFGRRLDSINAETLSAEEKAERAMLEANVRGRMHELEQVRGWERNPQIYAETVALSLAAQAIFAYAPAAERARRVFSKLRQVPRLLQSAEANVKDAPGIFVKNALETVRGVKAFIDRDLPRAFAAVDDLAVLSDLADAATEATAALDRFAQWLETEQAPRARGSFRLGQARFEKKLALDEGLTTGSGQLLTIALRELAESQEEFKRVAAKIDKADPVEVWRKVKEAHPSAGTLVATAREQVAELATFLRKHNLVSLPDDNGLVIGPTPPFYRWTFASVWSPGAFESRPLKTYYYLTDVDPSWSDEKKKEHLRDFSHAVLWSITAHEAYPGHVLHFQHVRRVESKLRRSILSAPTSFVEGWAHYGEQMIFEEGFAKREHARRLGQLAEVLVRLARLVVGVRLHAEDLSVEQGVRFFRDEAYLEESSARREAERGTFDPSYVTYALGRLMMLKLRDDVREKEGEGFSLRSFHDRVLGHGLAPFAFHRQMLLGEAGGPMLV